MVEIKARLEPEVYEIVKQLVGVPESTLKILEYFRKNVKGLTITIDLKPQFVSDKITDQNEESG
jgi:hypothetical protein